MQRAVSLVRFFGGAVIVFTFTVIFTAFILVYIFCLNLMICVEFVIGFLFAQRPAIFKNDPANCYWTSYRKWPTLFGHRIIPLYVFFVIVVSLFFYGSIFGAWTYGTLLTLLLLALFLTIAFVPMIF